MKDRTIILVSHHVQLCASGAACIVVLDNGRVQFQGDNDTFQGSDVIRTLVQSTVADAADEKEEAAIVETAAEAVETSEPSSETSSTIAPTSTASEIKVDKKPPRKLVEEEKRAVGRIGRAVWGTYFKAVGSHWYWIFFWLVFILAALSPVMENGWLKLVFG